MVAVFGSAGLLMAWDFGGKELWKVDLGVLDSGWFFDPAFQWGHSSSPVIYRNSVIVQADTQKGSYLAAWDLRTGKELWKTPRADEISTWGTPAIARAADGRDVIVTNGTKVRGYEAATGKLLWTLGPNSEITIGSPVVGNDLVFVTGGYPPVRPVYAIRPGSSGDISLQKGQESSQAVAWSNLTEGTYIPTPIVYDGLLFTLNINGVVTAYDAATGKRAFRGRIGTGGSFSASPVAADGRLYISSEDGEIYVVTAADGLAQVAKNDMKEVVMATPAISDGLIIVRTPRPSLRHRQLMAWLLARPCNVMAKSFLLRLRGGTRHEQGPSRRTVRAGEGQDEAGRRQGHGRPGAARRRRRGRAGRRRPGRCGESQGEGRQRNQGSRRPHQALPRGS